MHYGNKPEACVCEVWGVAVTYIYRRFRLEVKGKQIAKVSVVYVTH